MSIYQPKYIEAKSSGRLTQSIYQLKAVLSNCTLCPRNCGVNRIQDELGVCRTGARAVVSSFSPHFGEEAPLTGFNGSGTIFFTGCNLMCSFCQNWDISHLGMGREVTPEELSAIMLRLQEQGCHNINFVSPTHCIVQILEALDIAADNGLTIPLVYNTGGYDHVKTLKLLDGIIDIYLPDFKFWDKEPGRLTCGVEDYSDRAKAAIKEMHRQVGDLEMDVSGVAISGLLIRHLVLPEDMAGTGRVMAFIKKEISENAHVNVMSQYRPMGDACKTKVLNRPISRDEYRAALKAATDLKLTLYH